MDPVCHTLAGGAMAASGLGRRTALGTLTLLVGANLPDVDVLAYLDGPAADLAFRRGWTHGVLALALMPFLLTGAMMALDRTGRRLSGATLPSAVRPGQIFLLSTIAILSHPILDTLNTYGVRWLMPFSGRWFYGDALFIVDPWVWLALGAGIWVSRRRERSREFRVNVAAPARFAILVVAAYAAVMWLSSVGARAGVRRELGAGAVEPDAAIMAAPVLANPFRREVVVARDTDYLVGEFRWLHSPRLEEGALVSYPRGRPDHAAVAAAEATEVGRRFLGWARFPSYRVEAEGPGRYVVHIVDVRYARRPGAAFGAVSIPVELR